ncbi:hypothetical protein HBH47_208270 [Parastagonospora nodorum]|nr:hypothetical protein HBH47_208270 [Parastagonospora nodorum]KAH4599524.1 hypothetical protein HBH82_203630 [Parastagonospora nodorum]KAH4771961.1 hypothetical protein HBH62_204920 [Parastagonospora nodorum]KAH5209261.1 hypothetical protein HBH77_079980 [Parastagonospora nodorum]
MRRCHSCCGALNTICLVHVSANFWGGLTCGSLRAMPLSATHGPREVIMDSITLYNPPSLGAAGDRVRVVLAGARDGCSVVVVVGQGTNLGGRKPLRDRRRLDTAVLACCLSRCRYLPSTQIYPPAARSLPQILAHEPPWFPGLLRFQSLRCCTSNSVPGRSSQSLVSTRESTSPPRRAHIAAAIGLMQ